MEVDIEATTESFLKRQPIALGWLLFYGGGLTTCFMGFRMVAVLGGY